MIVFLVWVVVFIFFLICSIVAYILFQDRIIIRKQRDVMGYWIDNAIKGQSIIRFFEANSIRKVIIVGLDEVSERLVKALIVSPIVIKYVVDDRYCDKMEYLPGVKFVTNNLFQGEIQCFMTEKSNAIVYSFTSHRNEFIEGHDTKCLVESIERIVEICSEMERSST